MKSRIHKFPDGTKIYFIPSDSQSAFKHRLELTDGTRQLIEDILHRDGGPAVIYPNGFSLHFRHNIAYIAGSLERSFGDSEEQALNITPNGLIKWNKRRLKGRQVKHE